MLAEITIKDFAIIDQLTLQFAPGFNVLTGETGAGKSIILDAVSLLLGDRAGPDVVRTGERMAIIEGIFVLGNGAVLDHVNRILTREGLEGEAQDILTLSREVRSAGRSISRVNGRTVTLALLKEISAGLIDIHGQSEHLSLLKPASHIDLLDRYGNLIGQRAAFGGLVRTVKTLRGELATLIENEDALKQRAEMLSYQVAEINDANLQPDEDSALQDEATRLANSEQLAELSAEAYQALFGDNYGSSTNDKITQATLALSRLSNIDRGTEELAAIAEEVSVQVEELGRSLSDYQATIEYDPDRLSTVEIRLNVIKTMMRKYACETIEELFTVAEEAAAQLEAIENSSERITELQAQETDLLKQIGAAGAKLSRARNKVAGSLSNAIEVELADLKMETARFGVSIEQSDDPQGAPIGDGTYAFDFTGIDKVEYLIAPNIGEPLKPIARIASGGETSRIMLALKTVLSRADDTPALIFDEIDQGIGGRIGMVVGEKLWTLANEHQVLVVTHLPQLAGFADIHFKVDKGVSEGRTITHIHPIETEERIDELAEMLGAEAGSARQSAQEILQAVAGIKGQAAPTA